MAHNKTVYVFIAVLLCIAPATFPEELKVPSQFMFSLKDAIQIAYLANKVVQIQKEEIAIAKANIWDARSQFMPQVDVGAGFTYFANVLYNGNIRPDSNKDTRIFTGYQSENNLNLTISQIVFNGGANIANLNQAKIGLKIQEESLRARKLDVDFDAKRLFYGLLLAYETIRINQNLFDQAEAHYRDVKSKYDQGTSSKFDVLQSKVHVAKVIPDLVKARSDADFIMAELKKLLSIEQKQPLAISGELKFSLVDADEEAFLKEAYAHKPEMILRLLGVDMNRWGIEYAKAGYGPDIMANFAYTYKSNDITQMVNNRHDNWNAGITVTVPVFDGFSTKARVDEAKAKYAQSNLEKEDVVDQIAVDIKKGCLDLKSAKAVYEAEKNSIEEAREALKIANIAYDNGVMTNLDVLDAQVSLSDVEKNLAASIYDHIMAKAFLDKTMGREFTKEGN